MSTLAWSGVVIHPFDLVLKKAALDSDHSQQLIKATFKPKVMCSFYHYIAADGNYSTCSPYNFCSILHYWNDSLIYKETVLDGYMLPEHANCLPVQLVCLDTLEYFSHCFSQ